jgi:hypothetical protein
VRLTPPPNQPRRVYKYTQGNQTRSPQLELPDNFRHTRVSQLEGGRDFFDEPQSMRSIHPKLFFYIHRTCGRVSTPYRINLSVQEFIYAPAQDG